MPLAAEAWAAGDISASHLRCLNRARNRRTASAFVREEVMTPWRRRRRLMCPTFAFAL